MKLSKQKKLEKAGWKVGTVNEFLGNPQEESDYIEMKLALSRTLKKRRIKKRLSQVALAKKISSSQSRVAKMESGDPSVSIDLLMKSLLALGASKNELAKVLTSKYSRETDG
ncbi:helix-turn-helix transcriptional regulator [Nitrosococcus watsonii]|uniref:Transcriptional regulator, XRE family n=1 Tax=Nitrosococcus watsoni (strain C-113) TaxID=105559 RepID=D8KAP9_NITWC|nr:helix-turn-helix transcriptional regulator [Nitrosococcus watsonii]ADJ29476.1 transcriptional regulator, XRE family [Nitrosococcus watsonii C-113]